VKSQKQSKTGEISVKSKIWIEIGGLPFLGEGRRNLLKHIDESGSISQSAKDLGISYKKAWSYIKNMEERLGSPLVEKHVGGKGGGGSRLTEKGRTLIRLYDQLLAGTQETINKNFSEIFHYPPHGTR
jgi:molybdate transport system regulatory protein